MSAAQVDAMTRPQSISSESGQGSEEGSQDSTRFSSISELHDGSYIPIAIIGIGCKLPGEVKSAPDLWDFLLKAKSGNCPVPSRAFNPDGFYHPDTHRPGSLPFKTSYFINEDVHRFDNAFFGINKLEASYMDPQQRKLLEVVYECFENAGFTLDSIDGAKIGCYVGKSANDWEVMQYKDADYASHLTATGSSPSILANRLSYAFNLHGPSLTIDTACSSSIYSLHLACTAVSRRECDAAIVASANLVQTPEETIRAVKAGILSPEGICHTFDSSANGYGRGEAVNSLLIKRLDDALRDGDPVRAVIRATVTNANGKTSGISMPDATRQAEAVRCAYSQAGLSPFDTQYVEAHGTGTSVGDPIEVDGLVSAMRPATCSPEAKKLYIGSVKTNMGHSEGASALTSIIKVVLALENGVIPPSIGIKNLNPNLKPFMDRAQVVTESIMWPKSPSFPFLRRAGVNSFGFGGANGHVIIESPAIWTSRSYLSPLPPPIRKPLENPEMQLIPMTANSKLSFKAAELRLKDYLKTAKPSFKDLAWTLGYKRQFHRYRSYAISDGISASNTDQRNGYELAIARSPDKAVSPKDSMHCVMVFTGQGAQWSGMGRGLIERFPTFRNAISKLDDILRGLEHAPPWTLKELLTSSDHEWDINTAAIAQPLCTALQIGLIDLLKDWSVLPQYVLGHSSGEIAAAYCVGAISAHKALSIAYYRGFVVSNSLNVGSMAAVGLGAEDAQRQINASGLEGKIRIACVNSPSSVTASGDIDGMERLVTDLSQMSIFVRALKTDGKAYHSHHMSLVGKAYETLLQKSFSKSQDDIAQPEDRKYKMISSVDVSEINYMALNEPCYWRRNLESTVQFSPAVQKILQDCRSGLCFVEIGPHSVLKLPLEQASSTLSEGKVRMEYLPTLLRDKSAVESILKLAGEMFCRGVTLPFDKVNNLTGSEILTDLPPYSWDHDDIIPWKESRVSRELRLRKHSRHMLLGTRIPGSSTIIATWQNVLRLRDLPWLENFMLNEQITYPLGAYILMAVKALRQYLGIDVLESHSVRFINFRIAKPIMLSADNELEIVTDLQPLRLSTEAKSKKWFTFETYSISSTQDTCVHASGQIAHEDLNLPDRVSLDTPFDGYRSSKASEWYESLEKIGQRISPSLRNLHRFYRPADKAESSLSNVKAEVMAADINSAYERDGENLSIILLLDAAFQVALSSISAKHLYRLRGRLPVSFKELRIHRGVQHFRHGIITASCQNRNDSTTQHDLEMVDDSGIPVIDLRCAELTKMNDGVKVVENLHAEDPLLRICWKPDISFIQPANQSTLCELMRSSPYLSLGSVQDYVHTFSYFLDLHAHKWPDSNILFLKEQDDANEKVLSAVLEVLKPVAGLRRMNSLTIATHRESSALGYVLTDIEADWRTQLENADSQDVSSIMAFQLIMTTSTAGYERLRKSLDYSLPEDLERSIYHLGIQDERSAHIQQNVKEPYKEGLELECCAIACDQLTVRLAVFNAAKRLISLDDSARALFYVYGSDESPLDRSIVECLQSRPQYVVVPIPFTEILSLKIPKKAIFVISYELQTPLLATLTAEELKRVQFITDKANIILWLTSDAFHDCSQPDLAMVAGLARAVMVEQPATKFLTLDLGLHERYGASESLTCDNILSILERSVRQLRPEFETAQRKGLIWVSRFLPDGGYNEDFRRRHRGQIVQKALQEVGKCQLAWIEQDGITNVFFEGNSAPTTALGEGFIEVKAQYFWLDAADTAVLSTHIDHAGEMSATALTGVVSNVPSNLHRFNPGDHVLVMAPMKVGTFVTVPEWACIKLHAVELLKEMTSLPKSFSTAIYALIHSIRLQRDDHVLVSSAGSSIGQAFIQVAQACKAKVMAITETEDEKQALMFRYGLASSAVLTGYADGLRDRVISANHNQAFDVVISAVPADASCELARCCTAFGSFVHLSQKSSGNATLVDMSSFSSPSVRYISIDLDELFYSQRLCHHELWQKLLQETVTLYRGEQIQVILPTDSFDVADIAQFCNEIRSETHLEEILLSMENQSSLINYRPARYQSVFDSSKTYVLIGGLGGLGRSLSRWMVERGAVKLTFLNRSGLDKQSSRDIVTELEHAGAEVTVVRGNVDIRVDVERLIKGISGPIGGVIHAAMGLHEAIFSPMTHEQWLTAVTVKVQGTWHLHRALQPREHELDFFVVMSSNTGSVGTATESNYCAANAFLDSFARFRRLQGLKAVSVGFGMISEVGYIHEHPEIEKILLRKGIHPINQDEMLQMMDTAIAQETFNVDQAPDYHCGHILTGLELIGLLRQREQGFEGHFHILDDPRFGLLAHNFTLQTEAMRRRRALLASESDGTASSGASFNGNSKVAAALAAASVPGKGAEVHAIVNSILEDGKEQGVTDEFRIAVHAIVAQKMANLVMLPPSDLGESVSLGQFGIDSMLAAEFRSHITRTLYADVPFTAMLDPSSTIATLVDHSIESFGKAAL